MCSFCLSAPFLLFTCLSLARSAGADVGAGVKRNSAVELLPPSSDHHHDAGAERLPIQKPHRGADEMFSFPSAVSTSVEVGESPVGSLKQSSLPGAEIEKEEDVRESRAVSTRKDGDNGAAKVTARQAPQSRSPCCENQVVGGGEGDDVYEDDHVTRGSKSLEDTKRKALYQLTKARAPSTSGLIPALILGFYSLYLFVVQRENPDTVKEMVLEDFPSVPESYLRVLLHPASPLAFAAGSAFFLSKYIFSRQRVKAYSKLLDRSFPADKHLSVEEQSKAFDDLLVYHRDHREKPPIQGFWELLFAVSPFVAERMGLLNIFGPYVGVVYGRLGLGNKVGAGALALYGVYSIFKSLQKRRDYERRKKELFCNGKALRDKEKVKKPSRARTKERRNRTDGEGSLVKNRRASESATSQKFEE